MDQGDKNINRQKLNILALAAALVATCLADTSFSSPAHPLGWLLKRAETVLVVRMASHTETNAVFEVAHVLRGDPKLQKLSLSHTRAGRELPKNTRGLLLFSQGDRVRGKPKGSFQVGQPIKGQAGYCGWILMEGPGESKEALQRLKELVKQNPYKPDLHGKSSDKTKTLRDLAVSALMAKLRAERDAEVANALGQEILARFEDSWMHGGPPSIAEDAEEYQLPRQVVQTLVDDFESFVKIPPARKPDCVSSWRIGDFVYVHGFTMEEKGCVTVTRGPDGVSRWEEWSNTVAPSAGHLDSRKPRSRRAWFGPGTAIPTDNALRAQTCCGKTIPRGNGESVRASPPAPRNSTASRPRNKSRLSVRK